MEILLYSGVLLQWIVFAGFAGTMISLAVMVFMLASYLAGTPPAGFTSLMVVNTFIGSLLMTTMGVLGIYIGKIFEQVRGRPLFVIAKRVGKVTVSSRDEEDLSRSRGSRLRSSPDSSD